MFVAAHAGLQTRAPVCLRSIAVRARAHRSPLAEGAAIGLGGEGSFYRTLTDTIHMPDRTRFVGSATSSATKGLYATLLHELTHWTGRR